MLSMASYRDSWSSVVRGAAGLCWIQKEILSTFQLEQIATDDESTTLTFTSMVDILWQHQHYQYQKVDAHCCNITVDWKMFQRQENPQVATMDSERRNGLTLNTMKRKFPSKKWSTSMLSTRENWTCLETLVDSCTLQTIYTVQLIHEFNCMLLICFKLRIKINIWSIAQCSKEVCLNLMCVMYDYP